MKTTIELHYDKFLELVTHRLRPENILDAVVYKHECSSYRRIASVTSIDVEPGKSMVECFLETIQTFLEAGSNCFAQILCTYHFETPTYKIRTSVLLDVDTSQLEEGGLDSLIEKYTTLLKNIDTTIAETKSIKVVEAMGING